MACYFSIHTVDVLIDGSVPADGALYQGTSVRALFGWAGSLNQLVVAVSVGIGLGLIGVSTFVVNCINRPPAGLPACMAMVIEPVLAAGFARGMHLHVCTVNKSTAVAYIVAVICKGCKAVEGM